jgi:FAD/FMN-containing dehydrogenase
VSGFDLARLLVGSRGTLGMMGELVLRCLPRPAESVWLSGTTDPFELRRRLFRPTTILWDGRTTWVNLEGSAAEVAAEAAVAGLAEVDGPPAVPTAGRRSLRPRELRNLDGSFLAEIGVGVVHVDRAVADAGPPAEVELHGRVKANLDPDRRFSPGRTLWSST